MTGVPKADSAGFLDLYQEDRSGALTWLFSLPVSERNDILTSLLADFTPPDERLMIAGEILKSGRLSRDMPVELLQRVLGFAAAETPRAFIDWMQSDSSAEWADVVLSTHIGLQAFGGSQLREVSDAILGYIAKGKVPGEWINIDREVVDMASPASLVRLVESDPAHFRRIPDSWRNSLARRFAAEGLEAETSSPEWAAALEKAKLRRQPDLILSDAGTHPAQMVLGAFTSTLANASPGEVLETALGIQERNAKVEPAKLAEAIYENSHSVEEVLFHGSDWNPVKAELLQLWLRRDPVGVSGHLASMAEPPDPAVIALIEGLYGDTEAQIAWSSVIRNEELRNQTRARILSKETK